MAVSFPVDDFAAVCIEVKIKDGRSGTRLRRQGGSVAAAPAEPSQRQSITEQKIEALCLT